MNVHQLSITYVPEQDRILVRVNTQEGRELQFWFTRRLTLGFSSLLDRMVTDHLARPAGVEASRLAGMDELAKMAVAQFQRSETLKSADFATPYRVSEANVPLFESPLLVTEINLAPLGHNQLRMRCAEKLTGGAGSRNFQMTLSEQLVHAFVHLLERALKQSQWRDLSAPDAGTTATTEPHGGGDKPGYLN